MEKYVRAVSRSIAMLQAINRYGSLTLIEIARIVDLPHPTAYRIIRTLMHEGLIECEPTRKSYRVTALVQSLAIGFQDHGKLVAVARPFMGVFTKKMGWPLSINTHVGQWMIIRDSTNAETSLTFTKYHPGHTFPILESSSGLAYLAFVSDEERAGILRGIELIDGRSKVHSRLESGDLAQTIRAAGYAVYDRSLHTPTPGKTSSISVPVFERGKTVAALTLTLFSSAMSMDEAVRRYLPELQETAAAISAGLMEDWPESR
jgi:IclR family mhp operon transcriptional activator